MTINKTKKEDQLTVAVEGRIDTVTSPELEGSLKESMGDAEKLVIDLKDVDYISSAGLRVLLATHKKLSELGGMKIKNVCSDIMDVFEITGFNEILEIEQ